MRPIKKEQLGDAVHMAREAALRKATCIDDLREIAQRHVPRAFFQYADHGSYTQSTMRANRADLEAIPLRQRVAINVDDRDLSTTVLGEQTSLPFALAPIGLCGMQYGDGEILACRAAQEAGIPFCLSTMSICSIEDVAANVGEPFWFQLYVMRDRGFVRSLIERAIEAKCSALMPTLDLQILGQRHCDIKNGMTVPPEITLANILDVATKPTWAWSVFKGKRKNFGNIAGHIQGMDNVNTLAQWMSKQFDPTLNWKDLDWIRRIWPGKIILKGILDVEDAKIAADLGVSAIVVSNHGGRQLDGAKSSISMLERIVDAVGDKVEVLFDGGVRTGQDVLRALALGARSCMVGRAFIYGLGAGGQPGVSKAIDILRKELDVSMALTGTRAVRDITPAILARH
ncbi:L-lactate dehydrogenase (cytochrome) [Paraburkholderia tropica]|uniref:L-lactate dehydrogenase (Cytochrome) n=3 Tax=Burkholderiales TaxID=80840 RepID=A0ABX5MFB2_9BURK|nr:L-lactate dehydrogenase (cytochrome) [Paraburkholderia tropica]PXX05256.1 L-lactate dehydrogenase (cytochrome) [Paraburkholderia tropica]PZW70575.1 L-lactate dehydrogenase (cytochrome) [Paraburkholderia tropica]